MGRTQIVGKFTQCIVQLGLLPCQDFDGVDFPSSSASMLETEEIECGSIKIRECAIDQQTSMWAACAKKYDWQILRKDVKLQSTCKAEQFKTSNEHFVECSQHANMPNMKWSSNGGEASCARFDNACKKAIQKKLRAKSPDDWESERKRMNRNARVVRFIKLGQ